MLCSCRFDKILEHLERSIAKGTTAADYIRGIDPEAYTRYAFPLPRLGKTASNPAEQANSGLLNIREYAPYKLLVEMWIYMQTKFNERRIEAGKDKEVFTVDARERLAENQKSHGQWHVLDDGFNEAKVQTTDHQEEYLVSLCPKPLCSCFELQEMIWPCEHMIAWDNRDGRDYTRHFHPCWRVQSLRRLYSERLPCYLTNDLEPITACHAPEAAVKRGRHRVVRIQSGTRIRNQERAEDEFEDEEGYLFRRYPIEDNPQLVNATNPSRRRQPQARDEAVAPTIRRRAAGRRAGPNKGQTKCSNCGRLGHNRRTCNARTESMQPGLEAREGATEEEQVLTTGGPPLETTQTTPGYKDTEASSDSEKLPIEADEASEAEEVPTPWDVEREMEYYINIANECAFSEHTDME